MVVITGTLVFGFLLWLLMSRGDQKKDLAGETDGHPVRPAKEGTRGDPALCEFDFSDDEVVKYYIFNFRTMCSVYDFSTRRYYADGGTQIRQLFELRRTGTRWEAKLTTDSYNAEFVRCHKLASDPTKFFHADNVKRLEAMKGGPHWVEVDTEMSVSLDDAYARYLRHELNAS